MQYFKAFSNIFHNLKLSRLYPSMYIVCPMRRSPSQFSATLTTFWMGVRALGSSLWKRSKTEMLSPPALDTWNEEMSHEAIRSYLTSSMEVLVPSTRTYFNSLIITNKQYQIYIHPGILYIIYEGLSAESRSDSITKWFTLLVLSPSWEDEQWIKRTLCNKLKRCKWVVRPRKHLWWMTTTILVV